MTMTRQMPTLDAYTEEVEAKFPILGRLAWYSISDVKISQDDLADLCLKIGLADAYLPPRIQGQDAFRKATRSAERRRKQGGVESFEIVEVECEDWGIVCQVVQRVIDPSKSSRDKLRYETDLGTVTYYRADDVHLHGRVEVVNNAPVHDLRLVDTVNEMGVQIKEAFEDYSQYYHGNAIRSMVTRVLKACSTITVRSSGGVYFSPDSYRSEINKLKQFMAALNLYPGSRCEFHHLPLVDERDQRAMLTAAFEDESVVEVERTLDEIAEILKSGKEITPARYAKFVDSYKEMKAKSKEYADLLGEQMERTGDSLIMLDEQIITLLDKVKNE